MKRLALPIVALLLLALVWFLWPRHDEEPGTIDPNHPGLPVSSPAQSQIENQKIKIPPPPAASEISHLADLLNSPAGEIRADLRILDECLATFRTNFPRDGNPVGSNAEITAALTGRNKIKFAFIPPNHPAINRNGELCDRWGTPFYFHAESGTRMGIRSAGPDKKLYTEDDVVLTP